MTPERKVPLYEAFISYSHAADERLAPAVQSGLKRFAKRWYRTSGMRVFRDETNLAVNPALWASIQQGLADSAYFVLLASPRAAVSKWVKREVEFWLAHRGAQTLLIAQTDGTIRWDPEAADFDWRHTDALPSELRTAYPEEPKYADFTWAGRAADLSLRNPRFATEVARLVSAVRGRPLDELIGDDVRQRRRVRTAVAAAFLAIAAAATTAFLQWQNAETRGRLALSRQLANQGLNQLGQQLDLALLLSVEATRVAETVDARGSLLGALRQQPAFVTYLRAHASEVLTVAISPDGRTAVSGDATGKIVFWDLLSHKEIPPAINQGHRVGGVAISPNGATLASGSADHSVLLWDMRTHQSIGGPLRGHSGPVNSVAFSPAGELLVSGGSDGMIFRWDPGEQSQHGVPLEAHVRSIFSLRFSPDGKLLVAAGQEGARLLELGSLQWKDRPFANHGGPPVSG